MKQPVNQPPPPQQKPKPKPIQTPPPPPQKFEIVPPKAKELKLQPASQLIHPNDFVGKNITIDEKYKDDPWITADKRMAIGRKIDVKKTPEEYEKECQTILPDDDLYYPVNDDRIKDYTRYVNNDAYWSLDDKTQREIYSYLLDHKDYFGVYGPRYFEEIVYYPNSPPEHAWRPQPKPKPNKLKWLMECGIFRKTSTDTVKVNPL